MDDDDDASDAWSDNEDIGNDDDVDLTTASPRDGKSKRSRSSGGKVEGDDEIIASEDATEFRGAKRRKVHTTVAPRIGVPLW